MSTLGKIFFMLVFITAYLMLTESKRSKTIISKGQYFDLRGGSTVIEVNPAEKVVWFRCDKDSTYFYEPFRNIGIQ